MRPPTTRRSASKRVGLASMARTVSMFRAHLHPRRMMSDRVTARRTPTGSDPRCSVPPNLGCCRPRRSAPRAISEHSNRSKVRDSVGPGERRVVVSTVSPRRSADVSGRPRLHRDGDRGPNACIVCNRGRLKNSERATWHTKTLPHLAPLAVTGVRTDVLEGCLVPARSRLASARRPARFAGGSDTWHAPPGWTQGQNTAFEWCSGTLGRTLMLGPLTR